jgi:hypothetical protein
MPLALAALAWGAADPAAAQRRWAALDPNSETSSSVAWGGTEEEARQRAIDACKRVSKTCAFGPAVTDDLKDVFAVVCCADPRLGCATAAAANRREAMRTVQQTLADAGYSNCSVRHYISAATGRKQ